MEISIMSATQMALWQWVLSWSFEILKVTQSPTQNMRLNILQITAFRNLETALK